MSRPEALFPLFADLTSLAGVGEKTAKLFDALSVTLPRDLLYLLPHSVIDRRRRATIADLVPPAVATVEVEIIAHFPARRKGGPARVMVRDAAVEFPLVFFGPRADYALKQFPPGERRLVSGKVELFDGVAQMVHPDHVLDPAAPHDLPEFEPVYPATAGLSQKQIRKAALDALSRAPEAAEWADGPLMAREGWPSWRAALEAQHHPQGAEDVSPDAPARRRLAYDELFAHQLTLALARQKARKKPGISTKGHGRLAEKVLGGLPYAPTGAQSRAVAEIRADLAAPVRMNRLLQGDVGSGKTLVAFLALLAAVEAGGQGVLMAPTEILARQHYEGLKPLADLAGLRLEVLTGRDKGAERTARLAALAAGEIGILVGTHAVFQKDVEFHDLRLAVIDEQHRFGVAQRMELGAKGRAVDVLVMTATPIPRSLALAQYGDMDVSVLDEKPPGRKPIRTSLVADERLEEVVAHLKRAVAEGKQAYWVCPLVEESEFTDLTASEDRYQHLRAALGEGVVTLVHGQMPTAQKDAAMADFVEGRARVLVATTVIEVGVNVPAASIMVIERAETFGLAQLHQLRGRVGRGAEASSCLLLYQAPLSETGKRRLSIMRDTEDGFKISEEDLAMRGAGDLIGTAQSGLPRFRLADPERMAGLMETAQRDARKLLMDDPDLSSPRGKAVRFLLWLLSQDRAIGLLSVG
ncbi:ATP-dependent DNA helicase RecG [Falsigemmobacter intermedius]|uniref:Probable DNA 3'-5' helicase RecG n=2 Tax=Falsigemmobacter intermedius TaxID=1553448 RepID=A0A3S3WRY2_9RHOB|nr:ATP-dependent DNA helicase RecG [Falsigemmobacter intermedius]RWY43015.1 ATP-dependent DNA helicase RecG [Falsigemmobacter intermedius]